MLGLLLAVSLAPLCSAGNWNMGRWLLKKDANKGCEYDLKAMECFIKRSSDEKCTVFSPLCSGANVLLVGGIGGFDGHNVAKQAERDLKELLSKGCDESLKILNKVYLRESHRTPVPEGLIGFVVRYTEENVKKVFEEHKKWVNDESNGRLQTPLSSNDLIRSFCVCATLTYFKDQWLYTFNPARTIPGDFRLSGAQPVKRDFMSIKKRFLHCKHQGKTTFDLVVVPYARREGQHGFRRCAIYLVPENVEESLDGLWKKFCSMCKSSNYSIEKLLRRKCVEKDLRLEIPKIEELRSDLNLKDTLGEMLSSSSHSIDLWLMNAYIKVDEEGTEAAAIGMEIQLLSAQPQVLSLKVDRPHILLVYDKVLNRILFAVKDMGRLGSKDRSPVSAGPLN